MENSEYAAYLKSRWWYQRRNQALRTAGYRCRECGVNRQLEVHHLSYDHLGAEPDEDLHVLCRGCHLAEHFLRTQVSVGLYAKIIGEVLDERGTDDVTGIIEEVKVRCAARKIAIHPEPLHAALARLLPRFPWRPPEHKTALYTISAQDQPLTRAEAAALLKQLGAASAIKHMPEVRLFSDVEEDRIGALRIVLQALHAQVAICEEAEREPPADD